MTVTVNDPLVRFVDVQKTYDGEHLVVKKLNLDIQRGEFLTLLGPSGSGKSTCLMMLAGFETPTHGDILLNGQAINNVPPHKRDIGVVFQNYALFPHMSVAENVAFPLTVRKVNKTDAKKQAIRALEMVQLGSFADRRPGQLSGGQQQRVALARSLVFEPQLVLMDEPLGALDKKLREQMQIEIKHIHENLGVTMVFVTHDQDEALTMSDRVAVFNDGIIQQIEPPAELYERPANSFVANFIGETNTLCGEVLRAEGRECAVKLPNGAEITAQNVIAGQSGARTSVSIRPERVQLSEERPTATNVFEATVIETIYHGNHVRVSLDVAGQKDFRAMIRSGNIHADLNPGHKIFVGFSENDCRALDPISA
ncbi:ABC transporter ATP-binding protein [Terasakiella pusilla]|uniref:ABC transporter ATP-binding protein n=1 Tax=Terasakiella pusilla TaxID=64973 RepID=UPI003AA9DB61